MTIISWGPEYSIGIKALDDDHKRFIEALNELEIAMLLGGGTAAIKGTIAMLLAYTKSHFAKEEELMREFGFHGYIAHKAEHEEFIRKLIAFNDRLDRGDAAITSSVLYFMRDWATHHLLVTDRAYVECFKEHGL